METFLPYLINAPKPAVALLVSSLVALIIAAKSDQEGGKSNFPIHTFGLVAIFAIAIILGSSTIYFLDRFRAPAPIPTPTPQPKPSGSGFSPQEQVKIIDGFLLTRTEAEALDKYLSLAPSNPASVEAKISVNKSSITFTWADGVSHEPGIKIIGYNVYFGSNSTEIPYPQPKYETSISPNRIGAFATSNSVTFNNLSKGNVYHLYIQSLTNSQNPDTRLKHGVERIGTYQWLPAKKLYTYTFD